MKDLFDRIARKVNNLTITFINGEYQVHIGGFLVKDELIKKRHAAIVAILEKELAGKIKENDGLWPAKEPIAPDVYVGKNDKPPIERLDTNAGEPYDDELSDKNEEGDK